MKVCSVLKRFLRRFKKTFVPGGDSADTGAINDDAELVNTRLMLSRECTQVSSLAADEIDEGKHSADDLDRRLTMLRGSRDACQARHSAPACMTVDCFVDASAAWVQSGVDADAADSQASDNRAVDFASSMAGIQHPSCLVSLLASRKLDFCAPTFYFSKAPTLAYTCLPSYTPYAQNARHFTFRVDPKATFALSTDSSDLCLMDSAPPLQGEESDDDGELLN